MHSKMYRRRRKRRHQNQNKKNRRQCRGERSRHYDASAGVRRHGVGELLGRSSAADDIGGRLASVGARRVLGATSARRGARSVTIATIANGPPRGGGSPREPVAPWSNPETDNEKVTCICALKPMDGAPLAGKSAHGRRRQLPFTGSSDSSGHRNVRVREAPRTGSSSILSEHKAASSSDSPQEESAPPSSCSARQALSSIGSPEQESASPNSCSGASVDE